MTYAATMTAPDKVKAMFGLIKRSDVERAIREVREEMHADNRAGNPELQAELVEIAKRVGAASRPEKNRGTAQQSHLTPQS